MTDFTSFSGTVTRLLNRLPTKDEQVIQEIFNFYFQRLAGIARQQLRSLGGVRVADEEDLAMLVLTAFLKDATEGEIGELRSRHDVWRMLSKRVRLRAINMVRDERRKKRNEVGESIFGNVGQEREPNGINQQAGRDIQDLALFHGELIGVLSDQIEREIARLLFEGKDVDEIANKVSKSPATIYRKLRCIKEAWECFSKNTVVH